MRALHQGAGAVVGAEAGAGAGAEVRGGTGGVCAYFFQWHSTLKVFYSTIK